MHFAAETHVDRSILAAGEFIHTDVFGTFVLLEAAREAKRLRRFVQISTDEVYGSVPHGHSRRPTSSVRAIRTRRARPAPTASRTATGRPTACRSIITRASNNYGPNQFPEKVIPLFITNAIDEQPLPLYGDGLNVRDWLHVDDHCRAIDLLIEHGAAGEVYNIGGGNEVANVDLTHRILSTDGPPDVADQAGRGSAGPRSPLRARHRRSCAASAGGREVAFEDGLAADGGLVSRERVVVAPDQGRDPAFRAYYDAQYGRRPSPA